jgi:hypothetical protein
MNNLDFFCNFVLKLLHTGHEAKRKKIDLTDFFKNMFDEAQNINEYSQLNEICAWVMTANGN